MINSNYNNESSNELYSLSESKLPQIPNKEESQRIFWALGKEDFWMQIIDYESHKFGKYVFDQGLHGGSVEPGFFDSLVKGCEFASENLTEKPTVQFYKELNKTLCSHFIKDKYNNVCMNAEEAGTFRPNDSYNRPRNENFFENVNMKSFLISLFKDYEKYQTLPQWDEDREKRFWNLNFSKNGRLSKTQNLWMQNQKVIWMEKTKDEIIKEIKPLLPQALSDLNEMEKIYQVREANINDYITKISKELDVEPFVSVFYKDGGSWLVIYLLKDPQLIGQIVEKLFNRYNDQMELLNADLKNCTDPNKKDLIQNQKLGHIAELFQLLEWLHPFIDGQGRTDLVLLSKLLAEEGFTPAILEQPYFSTSSTPSEWLASLQEGLERFAEYARVKRANAS